MRLAAPRPALSIVVPVYNEERTVSEVLRQILAAGLPAGIDREIVVVDDRSTDGTLQRLEASASDPRVRVFRQPLNQGKGAALRHALARIAPSDFTHVLFMDGDGQHRPEDIPALVEKARATGADLVIGARSLDRSRMPRSRHFSNSVGSQLASRLVGRPIRDSQSGFRLISTESLSALRLRARRYEIEMEILIKLCRRGAKIDHAPVALVYDGGRARSKMRPIRDTVRICLWSLAFRYLGA